MLADGGEGIDEGSNVITFNLVLKNDETGPTRANEPLLELVLNLLKRGAIGGQIPGYRTAIPIRGYCDGPHSVVGVSVWSTSIEEHAPQSSRE